MNRIDAFLELAVQQGGSDLHLVSGQPPRIRIHGVLHPVKFRDLSVEDMEKLLSEFMSEEVRAELRRKLAVDFSYAVEGIGRFRVNAYMHLNGLAAVLRVVPSNVTALEALGLPSSITTAIAKPSGLCLVTGPTGSGKSTTLAAMIDHINSTRKGHIITIEDPIEFVHPYKSCVVTQREIGVHAPNFSIALRNALREDPDVILVGEMRDLETISLALTAAETGIQVFASLHTNGAPRSIDRIVNVFPARRQEQVRNMLAEGLQLVISQQLVPNSEGTGRLAVVEVLLNTNASASMIRAGKAHQLSSVIQSGTKLGMQSLDAQLRDLVRGGTITREAAYRHAIEKAQFETSGAAAVAA
jgi:twitching motility protein PilT